MDLFYVFVFAILSCLCHAALLSPARNGLTSWLFCILCFSVFVTFPYGIQGQVWLLTVSNPKLCLYPYFALHTHARDMKH